MRNHVLSPVSDYSHRLPRSFVAFAVRVLVAYLRFITGKKVLYFRFPPQESEVELFKIDKRFKRLSFYFGFPFGLVYNSSRVCLSHRHSQAGNTKGNHCHINTTKKGRKTRVLALFTLIPRDDHS